MADKENCQPQDASGSNSQEQQVPVAPKTSKQKRKDIMDTMEKCFGGIERMVTQKRGAASSASNQSVDDEDTLYGKLIAAKIKQIKSGRRKLDTKYKIEQLILTALEEEEEAERQPRFFRPFP